MSIIETYKDQFLVYCYDEDISRSDRLGTYLKAQGFAYTTFNSRGLFLETLEMALPHVVIVYYQPLSLKFRELLSKINQASTEIEVILLGSNEFWPGIHSLLASGLASDFWSWPFAGQEQVKLRLEKLIEKNIYKFIAEQRSDETATIVGRLDEMKEMLSAPVVTKAFSDSTDVSQLLGDKHKTESQMIEELVERLKTNFPASEFVYFKNYKAKDQLLVTRTSFASENYFRGQSVPFNQDGLELDRNRTFHKLRDVINETFSCDEFVMQPVEFAGQFYGIIMAVNFEDNAYLQKAARFLGVALRNYHLESTGREVDYAVVSEIHGVTKDQFPLTVSTEVSRARRLKSPLSVLVAQIEYVGEGEEDFEKAYALIKNNLRNYDFISHIDNNQIGIVLPHCRYEDAAIKAETLRRLIVAKGLKSQNTPLRLCFGVSEYPSLSIDSDSLIADAKKACTQVMVSGKNKVCLYTQEEGFEPEFTFDRA